LLCGINAARRALGDVAVAPPSTTALGSLLDYVTDRNRKNFQPMNANFGLFPPLGRRLRGRDKKHAMAERAIVDHGAWITEAAIEDSKQVSGTSSR
jgi:methylenetetrahydrofolate--tRNA-(uracil-5-)-methyltransferase